MQASFIRSLIVMAACAASFPAFAVPALRQIAERLVSTPCYADTCTYEILLPNFSDPIAYTVSLESSAAAADTLAGCTYFIRWTLPTPSGLTRGFSAYFGGDHFRYHNDRLQEYHFSREPQTFTPGGRTADGVQNRAQFADLLPQMLGRTFAAMDSDMSYRYEIRDNINYAGRKALRVQGVRRVSGYDALEFTYLLDQDTYMPLKISLENNPGQLGEQSVTVEFRRARLASEACPMDMETLLAEESEVMQRFRQSSFSLEELVGKPMPRIALPTIDGGRYTRLKGQENASPVIYVVLDTSVGSTPEVIRSVRSAAGMMPMNVEIVWAFLDKRHEDVDELVLPLGPSETALLNAGSLARDCGVGSVTPVLLYVAPDGRLEDFTRGVNQDLGMDVIEKTTLASGRR